MHQKLPLSHHRPSLLIILIRTQCPLLPLLVVLQDTHSATRTAVAEMGFLLMIFLGTFCFLGTIAGKLQVQADPSLVTAAVGEDVLLKCIFTVDDGPVDLSRVMIQWFHRGKQLVEFDSVVTAARPDVSLSREGLATGNASLLLSQVGTENSGNYRCYVSYSPELLVREVTLQVEDPSKMPEDDLEDSVSPLPCLSRSDVLSKLDQITKALVQLEAKLEKFITNKTFTGCDPVAAPPEPQEGKHVGTPGNLNQF
ncbi:CD276 antigen-like isoform X1 [Eublepharis macularius]|uniref:CD276 antigen-like isoform X1 n=1 Tax=Eublepharis macularius TaxID=481883 RepID=A0AA97K2V5_EUBMA|nr:CD276 antigen-like isoform X1 [Eublepharis macularius]